MVYGAYVGFYNLARRVGEVDGMVVALVALLSTDHVSRPMDVALHSVV